LISVSLTLLVLVLVSEKAIWSMVTLNPIAVDDGSIIDDV